MDKEHLFENAQNEAIAAKGVRTMSEWLTKVINDSEARGEARGDARGDERGTIRTLWNLVTDHILTEDEAAKRADLTVDAFRRKASLIMSESITRYDVQSDK